MEIQECASSPEDAWRSIASPESNLKKPFQQCSVPRIWGLFESVHSLFELENVFARNIHTLRRVEIQLFLKRCIEKSTFDVDLMKLQIILEGKHNQHPQGDHLSSGSKLFGIIGAFGLLKAFGAQTSLVFNGNIELVLLNFEDPGTVDTILFSRLF